jgi:uncharacterized membrane-anchored protein YitT (DUF2179 family)
MAGGHVNNSELMVKNRRFIKRALLILLSSLLFSLSLNLFVVPNHFLNGGVSGLALILQYATAINAGYSIIILNIPLFILSYKKLAKEFTLLTTIATIAQAILMILTKGISNYYTINDLLLASICHGVISGFAVGNIFKYHGSLGGTDIIAMIARKKSNFNIGKVSFIINVVIVSFGAIFFGVDRAVYTFISMYISSSVIDQVIKGFNKKNLVFIVTNKEELIVEKITKELRRSATVVKAKGGYTKADKTVIYCVVSTPQIPRVKQILEKCDEEAFMSIIDAAEVQGKGFELPI